MSSIEAWMEPCAWGRELVVSLPAAPGEEPPHVAAVLYDPDGRPLQSATSNSAALRHGDRWIARCLANAVASEEPVGSVEVDRVQRADTRFRLFLTADTADVSQATAVADGVVLWRVSLVPGPEPGTRAARLVVERSEPGEVTVCATVGFVGANERSGTARFCGPGVAVVEVEDLEPPDEAPGRLSVVVETVGPAVATRCGRVPVTRAPSSALPALAPGDAVGVASFADGELVVQARLPALDGWVQVALRLWCDGVPVWTVERPPERLGGALFRHGEGLRLPVPAAGALALELVVRSVRTDEGRRVADIPDEPVRPSPVEAGPPVGPVAVDALWTYAEDRPDLGRYRGMKLLLRNTGAEPIALSFGWSPEEARRRVSSGGELAPGATDLFDVSDDTPAGRYRVEIRAQAVGPVVFRGVLAVVRLTSELP